MYFNNPGSAELSTHGIYNFCTNTLKEAKKKKKKVNKKTKLYKAHLNFHRRNFARRHIQMTRSPLCWRGVQNLGSLVALQRFRDREGKTKVEKQKHVRAPHMS